MSYFEEVSNIKDRFYLIKVLGEGSFGRVYKAVDRRSGEIVALKELKQPCDPCECVKEIKALTALENDLVVGLKGVILTKGTVTVFLALEYMEGSLHDLIQQRLHQRLPFSEAEIRSLSLHLFKGLDFMHRQARFMHRDLKPANLLVSRGVVKISDLGSATEIDSSGPFHDYITTRFYRALEMLMRTYEKDVSSRPFVYDEKVDMWAAGAILAELFLMFPLFMGKNSADQLGLICEVMGAPTNDTWIGGMIAARLMNMPKLKPENGVGFREAIPCASEAAIDLIKSLCSWDPAKRPSAEEALQHPFFKSWRNVVAPPPGFSYCAAILKTTRTSHMQQAIY